MERASTVMSFTEIIPTNMERCRRHLCNCGLETLFHVLRDCSVASYVWKRILSREKWGSVHDWIVSNLQDTSICSHGVTVNFLFGLLCWQLWNRNLLCSRRST
ncbi:hypothetical protein MANES_05G067101v8 [Manihot esculenta]|uniref:Reverse transcriptase zinc-binding domain-containing protein n=1 Tax=Manihot esculenta TaxID=3983 RepID=A0A2C9VTX2_MANES|nr:hypothetical protein MANES_05G067101v8 [Manihot esculenta]